MGKAEVTNRCRERVVDAVRSAHEAAAKFGTPDGTVAYVRALEDLVDVGESVFDELACNQTPLHEVTKILAPLNRELLRAAKRLCWFRLRGGASSP